LHSIPCPDVFSTGAKPFTTHVQLGVSAVARPF
jgi:hypothetical protein